MPQERIKMGDREFLYDLALILDSAPTEQRHGEPWVIRIEAATAHEIASRLREIGNRIQTH